MIATSRDVLGWVWLLALVACAAAMVDPGVRQAREDAEQGRPEAAATQLEALRKRYPGDFDVHLELGVVYYKLARKALDEDRQADYVRYMGKALDEVVEAARLDPESPGPHTWMGIIAAYQDNLEGALRDFKNARRLSPRNPVNYLNLAQIYVYMGELSRARRYLSKAHRMGARGAFVDIVESLAAWRQGDLGYGRWHRGSFPDDQHQPNGPLRGSGIRWCCDSAGRRCEHIRCWLRRSYRASHGDMFAAGSSGGYRFRRWSGGYLAAQHR